RMEFAAQLQKAGTRAIGQRAVRVERRCELVRQCIEGRIGRAGGVEGRKPGSPGAKEAPECTRSGQRLSDLSYLRRRKNACAPDPPYRARNIPQSHDGERLTGKDELGRLPSFVEERARLDPGVRKRELPGERATHLRNTPRR